MFGGKTKLKLAVALSSLELLTKEIETLRQDKVELVTRLNLLQDALVAKESPIAYRDRQYTPEVKPDPRISNDLEMMHRYMEELKSDRPMFDTADDLIYLVNSARGVPQSKSIHNNDES